MTEASSMCLATGKRVAIVGSGNWGSAVARIVATNVKGMADYENIVKMWTFEEVVEGRKLTEIINEKHENVKYLPGVALPETVVACADLVEGCKDADVLVFVVPHQFLPRVLDSLKGKVKSGAVGLSLIKGLEVGPEGPKLLSEMIETSLALPPVAVLMGANVAADVVQDNFVEATMACRDENISRRLSPLFDCPSFRIQTVTDVTSVELCGAVKNVIAMGGGFCDGLDLGTSTKAAILRKGMVEMAHLCQKYNSEFSFELMMESCGVADVIATSFGGRNRRCAEEFVRRTVAGRQDASWDKVEQDLLNGQKLQGLGTLDELVTCIDALDCAQEFPLFYRIHGISRRGQDVRSIVQW
jgi:glycerol-3-phosphate dehydrogenase (NAD+)